MTSLDIEFRQLLVFPRRFLSGDRNQDNDKLQNGLYLDMPSHSSANWENQDATGFDRHVHMQFGASFATVWKANCLAVN